MTQKNIFAKKNERLLFILYRTTTSRAYALQKPRRQFLAVTRTARFLAENEGQLWHTLAISVFAAFAPFFSNGSLLKEHANPASKTVFGNTPWEGHHINNSGDRETSSVFPLLRRRRARLRSSPFLSFLWLSRAVGHRRQPKKKNIRKSPF